MNKKILILLLIVALLALLAITLWCSTAYAATLPTEENVSALEQVDVQGLLDKYIMPNVTAAITCIGSIIVLWNRFKSLSNTYKTDKTKFFEEATTKIDDVKGEVKTAIESIIAVRDKTVETVENLPIAKMQEAIAESAEKVKAEAQSILAFKELFGITVQIAKSITEASITLPPKVKESLAPLYEDAAKILSEVELCKDYKAVEEIANEVEEVKAAKSEVEDETESISS